MGVETGEKFKEMISSDLEPRVFENIIWRHLTDDIIEALGGPFPAVVLISQAVLTTSLFEPSPDTFDKTAFREVCCSSNDRISSEEASEHILGFCIRLGIINQEGEKLTCPDVTLQQNLFSILKKY